MRIITRLADRRAKRREAQRKCALMLGMMRDLNEMAADGLLAPDPVTYARAHVTSPGAHALLDEVERGRERRAQGRPSQARQR
jgi:hypothetical protein